jgi:hypothetical protein
MVTEVFSTQNQRLIIAVEDPDHSLGAEDLRSPYGPRHCKCPGCLANPSKDILLAVSHCGDFHFLNIIYWFSFISLIRMGLASNYILKICVFLVKLMTETCVVLVY